MNRRVLVLTHGFLPWAGAAAERVTNFCCHLRSYGWEPYIVCATEDSFHLFEDPRAGELWQNWVCERVPDHATWRAYRLADRAGMVRPWRALVTLTTGFPDIYRRWVERAKTAAERMYEDVQPAVVYSCSPPHSVHLLGLHLKERFGAPWIMDLRDAWVGNRRARYLTPLHRAMAARHNARCVGRADRIIANSDRLGDMIAGHLSERPERVQVITNGYEESHFASAEPARLLPGNAHTILYSGATFGGFVEDLLTQISVALDRVRGDADLRLVIVGETGGALPAVTPCGPVGLGYRSQRDIPGILMGADVLILVMDAPGKEVGSATISLKAYGYLRSGRPVVYIGPDGAMWQLVSRFPGTYQFDHGAWDAIAAKLRDLCRHREDWTAARAEQIRSFSWRALTGHLVDAFESACGGAEASDAADHAVIDIRESRPVTFERVSPQ